MLYVPGCVGNARDLHRRQPLGEEPGTGAVARPELEARRRHARAELGQHERNGLFQSGKGIADTTYLFPKLNVGPRFGMAYDISGTQRFVLRGSLGIYFDRPRGGNAQALVGNTFVSTLQTLRYSQLQSLGGLLTQSPAQLTAFQYNSKLPTSTEWSTGIQMLIPWSTSVDVAYVGHHNYNAELTGQHQRRRHRHARSIRTSRIRRARPAPRRARRRCAALFPDLVRGYRGYTRDRAARVHNGWRSYHAIQFSINRRFKNGVAFGFNDAITLQDIAKVAPRYDHDASGQQVLRADQAQAQELLRRSARSAALHEGHRVYGSCPPCEGATGGKRVLAAIVNDWQLSSIWTAATGTPYRSRTAIRTAAAT